MNSNEILRLRLLSMTQQEFDQTVSEMNLSPMEKNLLVYRITVTENPWLYHKPAVTDDGRSPQAAFLMLDQLEALYGGAAGGGKCLTGDHDVLTRTGWKAIADVKEGEEVLSWKEGQLCYRRVVATTAEHFDGVLVTHNGHFSFKATPNHRFITRSDVGSKPNRKSHKGKWRYRYASQLTGSDYILASGEQCLGSAERYSGDELELWGWWLAEGSGFNRKMARFSQVKEDGRQRIIELAKNLNLHFAVYQHEIRIRWQPPLPCGNYCYDKFVPRELFEERELKRLLDGIVGGDGWLRRKGFEFYSVSKRLAEDIQEICCRLGYRTYLRPKVTGSINQNWCVSAYPRGDYRVRHIGSEKYNGMVFCLTVEDTGNFMCRYKGRTFISGNSDALLMCALQYFDCPNYSAIIFRRTYQDLALPSALMDRARQWLTGTNAVWNAANHTWTNPASGAKITFGYMENESDVYRYYSAEFQLIAFDQVEQFSEWQYTTMMSRARRLKNTWVPIRIRSAANPSHNLWVKRRFIVEGKKANRPFIPAKLWDNPYVDKETYLNNLNQLDPVMRERLLKGNWDIMEASTINRKWFKIITYSQYLDMVKGRITKTVRAWDLAATEKSEKNKNPDYSVGQLWVEADGDFFVLDMRRFRKSPYDTEQEVKDTAEHDPEGTEFWMEEEGGSSGKNTSDHYSRTVFKGKSFYTQRSTGSKEVRAKPFASTAQKGYIYLIEADWNSEFLDEVELFPDGEHDDVVDCASLAISVLAKYEPLGGMMADSQYDHMLDQIMPRRFGIVTRKKNKGLKSGIDDE